MTIGILGGTFDPIHKGHMAIAQHALDACRLSQVLFIPCHIPALRDTPQTSSHDRLNMVKLAIKDNPHFAADDCELKRKGTSYMLDTLRQLQRHYPEENLALIIGYDAWQHIDKWHHHQQLLDEFNIIIINRPQYSLAHPDLLASYTSSIHILTDIDSPISATQIRQQLHKNTCHGTHVLAKPVYDYIIQHKLYR